MRGSKLCRMLYWQRDPGPKKALHAMHRSGRKAPMHLDITGQRQTVQYRDTG